MPKKHNTIVQELELHEVDGYTEAQKQYYYSLGFRPYKNEKGTIKWLMPDQHSLRIIQANKRPWLARALFPAAIQSKRRRRHKPSFVKFMRINWFFILLIVVIAVAVLFLMQNPSILF